MNGAAAILTADTRAACSAELLVHLNAVNSGLSRIARGAPDAPHIAEHCQRNLALALNILAARPEGHAACSPAGGNS
jgi:hypothetical protein